MVSIFSSSGGGCHAQAEVAPAETGLVKFARQRLGFTADAIQALLLEITARAVMLNCTRQWGKSTITALRAFWKAWTTPGALVLVISPSERQSRLFMRKCREFAGQTGVPIRGDGDNPVSLMLPNGARIVGLPGNEETVRGFSAVSMLIIDEAARVPDAMYEAVLPMLAVSDGEIWMLSTPRGQTGFFYDEWNGDARDWHRVTVKATDCPRISPEFLEKQRRRRGQEWFRKEYMCEFVADDRALFDRDKVEAMFKDYVQVEAF